MQWIDERTPLQALIDSEESPCDLAAREFSDDIHRDPKVHEATVRLMLYLVPQKAGDRVLEAHPLEAIGRRVLGLAVLIRWCGESCEDLAQIYGGTRASYSRVVKEMEKKLGIPAPDRSAAACEAYKARGNGHREHATDEAEKRA